jgi:hypothetical protein
MLWSTGVSGVQTIVLLSEENMVQKIVLLSEENMVQNYYLNSCTPVTPETP